MLSADLDKLINHTSVEIFGTTAAQTFYSWPDNFDKLPREEQYKVEDRCYEHEKRLGCPDEPAEELLPILLDRGIDFADEAGKPLVCTTHLARQAMAAAKGIVGKLPEPADIDAITFEERMQTEARAWKADKRKPR